MDELELLKKDWQRQDKNLPHYDSEEIAFMMHKKSKSIVKWIFIISVAELVFWIGLESLSFFQQSNTIIEELGLQDFYRISLIINYVMIFVFIGLFFRNYRKISIKDSVKTLLKNIIITRQTVKAYVWFNVIVFSISFVVVCITTINQSDQNIESKLLVYAIMFAVLVLFILLIIGFYHLLYGILTRRLNKNYKILKEIDKQE